MQVLTYKGHVYVVSGFDSGWEFTIATLTDKGLKNLHRYTPNEYRKETAGKELRQEKIDSMVVMGYETIYNTD